MLLTNEETYPTIAAAARPGELRAGQAGPRQQDPVAVAARLRSVLPRDVKVYTRDEINAHERRYWLERHAIGQFFTSGWCWRWWWARSSSIR